MGADTFARLPRAWHRLLNAAGVSGHEWNLLTLAAEDQRRAAPGGGFYTNPRYFNAAALADASGIAPEGVKKALQSLARRRLPDGQPVIEPTIDKPGRNRAQVWRVNLPRAVAPVGGTALPPKYGRGKKGGGVVYTEDMFAEYN